ncbi:MAG: tyrosine-protein kinase domain-containing protein [Anaerolineae bacterium]
MPIRDYVRVLARRKWIIALVTFITVAIVAAGTLAMTPIYTASAVIRVAQVQEDIINYDSLQHAQRIMNTYVYLLQSRAFLDGASQKLGAGITPELLEKTVEVELMADTELLRITASNSNPVVAANIANVLANMLVGQGSQIYTGPGRSAYDIVEEQLAIAEKNLQADRVRLQMLLSEQEAAATRTEEIQELNARISAQEQTIASLLESRDTARLRESLVANSISIVEAAGVPSSPTSPRTNLNLALGVLIGLIAGVALAFVLDNMDPTLYSSGDLAKAAGASMVIAVPALSLRRQQRNHAVLLNPDGSGPAHEAFRSAMQTVLRSMSSTPSVLLVGSAEPSAGRSTVVANLAAALSRTGRRVIVVDADLREPVLHQVFGVGNAFGLTNMLLDSTALADPKRFAAAVQQTRLPNVRLLTSGPVTQHGPDMLGSAEMVHLVAQLRQQADVILLDSPAMLSFADAAGLAEVADGVLLVAAAAEATDKGVESALGQLNEVGARIAGVLLNKAERAESTFAYYQPVSPLPVATDQTRPGSRPEEFPSVARDATTAR